MQTANILTEPNFRAITQRGAEATSLQAAIEIMGKVGILTQDTFDVLTTNVGIAQRVSDLMFHIRPSTQRNDIRPNEFLTQDNFLKITELRGNLQSQSTRDAIVHMRLAGILTPDNFCKVIQEIDDAQYLIEEINALGVASILNEDTFHALTENLENAQHLADILQNMRRYGILTSENFDLITSLSHASYPHLAEVIRQRLPAYRILYPNVEANRIFLEIVNTLIGMQDPSRLK